MIIYLEAHSVDKSACQLLWCLELFSPPLSQTLAKPWNGVYILTNFLKLKFDHKFGCTWDKQAYTPTFLTFWATFNPLNPTLGKPHDGLSLLSNFLELKCDRWFGCPFHRKACTPTFVVFEAIFNPLNGQPWQNRTMKFHFWPISLNWCLIIYLHTYFIEKRAHQLLKYFEQFGPLIPTLSKTHDRGFTFEQFLSIEIKS